MSTTARTAGAAATGSTLSNVIVEKHTLSSAPYARHHRPCTDAIAALARDAGITAREAAAVVAQSYGLHVSFRAPLELLDAFEVELTAALDELEATAAGTAEVTR